MKNLVLISNNNNNNNEDINRVLNNKFILKKKLENRTKKPESASKTKGKNISYR